MLEEKEAAVDHLDGIHEEYLTRLNDYYENITRKSRSISNLSTSFDHQKRLLDSYIKHLEDTLQYVVKLYRETNISERSNGIPNFYSNKFAADLGYQGLDIEYQSKEEEIKIDAEILAKKLPEIRNIMLDTKEQYHNKIDQICQL